MQIVLYDLEGYQLIECPHCHWAGKSFEIKKGDYLELSRITEIFCPSCNKYLGFIQHDDQVKDAEQ